MAIRFQGKELKSGTLNGRKLKEVWLNGKKIWPAEAAPEPEPEERTGDTLFFFNIGDKDAAIEVYDKDGKAWADGSDPRGGEGCLSLMEDASGVADEINIDVYFNSDYEYDKHSGDSQHLGSFLCFAKCQDYETMENQNGFHDIKPGAGADYSIHEVSGELRANYPVFSAGIEMDCLLFFHDDGIPGYGVDKCTVEQYEGAWMYQDAHAGFAEKFQLPEGHSGWTKDSEVHVTRVPLSIDVGYMYGGSDHLLHITMSEYDENHSMH